MKRHITFMLAGLLLLISSTDTGHAEVKKVRMKIAGYLCGN